MHVNPLEDNLTLQVYQVFFPFHHHYLISLTGANTSFFLRVPLILH